MEHQNAPIPPSRPPRVAVVGAGIVGSAIAYELQKRGAEVTLIDRDEPGQACSYGNSGAISPGSVAPLAMPGVLASLPKMLLDERSPLYLPLSYLPRALPWLLRFIASASPRRVEQAAERLHAIHVNAVQRHRQLTQEIGAPELLMQRGHLHLYPDAGALEKDATSWRMRKEFGYEFETLDRAGIEALEPNVGKRYQVGVFLQDHATIVNPGRSVKAIVRAFEQRGGQWRRTEVRALRRADFAGRPRWCVVEADGREDECFDEVVVAAGAWSRKLTAPLGLEIPLESQRGYHVQFRDAARAVTRTVVLADRKVFVTPMEEGLRVGGTVEIGGLSRPPDMRRAAMLERIARETFDGLDDPAPARWMGHRPCMPDSVPIVGPADGHPGLWLAVGHGHLGVTDSVNTAYRIADRMLGVGIEAEGRSVPPFPETADSTAAPRSVAPAKAGAQRLDR